MKRITGILCLILLGGLSAAAQVTEKLYLSGRGNNDAVEWEFRCTAGNNSGRWTEIPVPSNWECQGFGQYTYGHMPLEKRVNESGEYRFNFTVPSAWKGKRVEIVFGAVMTDADVKINGKRAGDKHQGGYYEFRYDVSRWLEYGKSNLLEVQVDKLSSNESIVKAESKADFWVFGGIFRPVWLEARPASSIEHVSIDANSDGRISVLAELNGNVRGCRLISKVRGADGKVAGEAFGSDASSTVNMKSFIPGVSSWSDETPVLYNLELSLVRGKDVLHTETVRFGFRTVEVRPSDGVYVNGVKIKMKGVNRHSFWPTSGRTLNDEINLQDALLIKEMNMNAVRCSHYPPERRFLDICDSLGLYVIDELTGWQDAYDTEAGRPLVREMIRRDVNHPSILFWSNGNEGGFNFELVEEYARQDIQKRTVIHPWLEGETINNFHYPSWNTMYAYLSKGNKIWFPTEFNHGLYDGGHGAGLEDYWAIMQDSPLCAGGFLWDFSDQGIVRTDRDGEIDTDGNHGADGTLGPYRQKEGSFYAIKDIWSPVQIMNRRRLPPSFDGRILLENRYGFTNLTACRFKATLKKYDFYSGEETETVLGTDIPDIAPGMKGYLTVGIPSDFAAWDVLEISAFDSDGRNICNWTGNISPASAVSEKLLDADRCTGGSLPILSYSLTECDGEKGKLEVTETASGWTKIEYAYLKRGLYNNIGVTFKLKEDKVKGVKWLGNGPYRVWKNRMRGGTFGVWQKEFNDTATGESWVYPEFKGYYSNMYACDIETGSGLLRIVFASDDLFLHLMSPRKQEARNNDNTSGIFPDGDISVLSGISPVGTKFKKASQTGPQGAENYVEYDQKKHTEHAAGCFYMKFIPNQL